MVIDVPWWPAAQQTGVRNKEPGYEHGNRILRTWELRSGLKNSSPRLIEWRVLNGTNRKTLYFKEAKVDFVKVIPCLDIRDGRVVKGVKFVNLRDARDPVEAAEAYSDEGADEIVFLDIAASLEGRKTRLEWVKKVCEKVGVPLAVGGGISNLDDMQSLFELGVNKASINTAAVKNPGLIKEAAQKFGRERLVVAVDGRKNRAESGLPRLEVVIKGGTEGTGLDLVEWAKKVEELGAGEILLTSKDTDGTKEGYDLKMTRAVAEAVGIPVTASGGAGKLEHLYEAVVTGKASAVLAASIFHFGELSIQEVKKYLWNKGIPVKI